MPPEEDLAEQFLTLAEDDLRVGERALDREPPIPWAAGFHAQQAAEKALKALLTHHGMEVPRTHDIGYLVGLCREAEPDIALLGDAAAPLSDFAVHPRYPLPASRPSLDRARQSLDVARKVREFVRSRLA